MRWKRNTWWVAGLSLVSALTLASTALLGNQTTPTADTPSKAELHESAATFARSLSEAFSEVADEVRPSVVTISSVKQVSGRVASGSNDPFREFFGDDFFERFGLVPQQQPHDFVQRGQGSGVIVSKDGYILTNNHVVADADEVSVKLPDERTFTAKVVGTDPRSDLAVLKIDAEDLVPATLGSSSALKVGEWVVAVGNPFGLSSSITAGIVSATGRANVGVADYEDFIQTDAAINPGNSGGPLVNLEGEVVGINTAIFSRSGGYMGIGFAIPVDMAQSVMNSLIEDGRVARGWLGITIQKLEPGLAQSFGYERDGGVLVGDVTAGSPADEGGLKSGDIIEKFAGEDVQSMQRFRSRVASVKPGTGVDIEVFRDGANKKLHVKLGELETTVAQADQGDQNPPVELGMTVRTLTPELARQLGEDTSLAGVVVTDVDPLGPAARSGIAPNLVILDVAGHKVDNVEDFREQIAKADLDKGVRMTVESNGIRRFVFLQKSAPIG